jgi:hypothetical protein
MGLLFDKIRKAVKDDRFVVAWHADERCEERFVTPWQLAAGLEHAELLHERPHTKRIHPSLFDNSCPTAQKSKSFGHGYRELNELSS